ncbi:hypothetical protein [Xylella fastidiosa]
MPASLASLRRSRALRWETQGLQAALSVLALWWAARRWQVGAR